MNDLLGSFRDEFARYRNTGERALAQVSDEDLNRVLSADCNSMAMIVRHISGNFVSRFTDFLTADGEKPWRKRDAEFETRSYTRAEVQEVWQRGWSVLEAVLATLTENDLGRTVSIRGVSCTAHDALTRSVAHVAYHVGQIVILARLFSGSNWKWITIPKGMSETYNRDPARESKPTR